MELTDNCLLSSVSFRPSTEAVASSPINVMEEHKMQKNVRIDELTCRASSCQ